jgi:lipopolysaccharide export system protein LptA
MVLLVAMVLSGESRGQVNVTGRGRNFVAPVTDAQGRKSVLRGKDVKEVKPAGSGLVEILGMQAETFRGQAKDMIVEAPQCVFDTKAKVASSSGPLSIRTADGRFSITGTGFRWEMGDSRQSSKLVISNQVHSSIRKRFIGSGAAFGAQAATNNLPAAAPAQSGGEASAGDFIEIDSQQFEYQNDMAAFRGAVRAKESEGGLECAFLTVIFQEGGAVDRIEAEQDVVLRQGGMRGTADRAVYIVGEGRERVAFIGNAVWEDGVRQGKGEHLTFDRLNHVLRAETNAYLRLPRAFLGQRGFFALSQPVPASEGKVDGGGAVVEVYSDQIVVQLPATNGPVQSVTAEGNVLIVDADQDARALANRAVYQDSSGVLELAGTPMFEMQGRTVTGQTLRFVRDTGVFTAAPDAYVKLPFEAVADLGILPVDGTSERVASTNRFVEIWSREFNYQTNLLQFLHAVRVNFLEGDESRGKLSCASLEIRYGQRPESMLAEGDVMLEQFPIKGSARPVSRRVACERLRAKFDARGRLENAVAELGVTADQEEHIPGQPAPVRSRLTAETVSAFFAPGASQVDRIVADQNVLFVQDARIARGSKAVYSSATGLMELTGAPTATMPEGKITGAERLIWDRVRGTFSGKGTFKSEWKRSPGSAAPLRTSSLPRP